MRTKKRKLTAICGVLCLGVSAFALYQSLEQQLSVAKGASDIHEGYHYAEKSATSSEAGNKEFWACCLCHEQFLEQPEGSFQDRTLTETLADNHIAYVAPISVEKSVTFEKMTLAEKDGKQYFQVLGNYTGDITTDYVYVNLALNNAGGYYNFGGKSRTELILDSSKGEFIAQVDITNMISMNTWSYYIPSLVVNNETIEISTQYGSTEAKYISTDNSTSQFRLQKDNTDTFFRLTRESKNKTIPDDAEITGYTGVKMENIGDRVIVSLSGTSINHTRTSLCLSLHDFRMTHILNTTVYENMTSNSVVAVKFDSATGNFEASFDVTNLEGHVTAYKVNVSKTVRSPSANVGSRIGYEIFKPFEYNGTVDTTTVLTVGAKKYNFVYRSNGYDGALCIQVKNA